MSFNRTLTLSLVEINIHDPKWFVFRLYTQNLSLKAALNGSSFWISNVTDKNKIIG